MQMFTVEATNRTNCVNVSVEGSGKLITGSERDASTQFSLKKHFARVHDVVGVKSGLKLLHDLNAHFSQFLRQHLSLAQPHTVLARTCAAHCQRSPVNRTLHKSPTAQHLLSTTHFTSYPLLNISCQPHISQVTHCSTSPVNHTFHKLPTAQHLLSTTHFTSHPLLNISCQPHISQVTNCSTSPVNHTFHKSPLLSTTH
jgi:hypothetical protein